MLWTSYSTFLLLLQDILIWKFITTFINSSALKHYKSKGYKFLTNKDEKKSEK